MGCHCEWGLCIWGGGGYAWGYLKKNYKIEKHKIRRNYK